MILLLLLAHVLLAPAATRASSVIDSRLITEWKVPWEGTRPRDPALDREGRVWFCGQEGNYIGMLEPRSGSFKRYELSANTNPHDLIGDAQGVVWLSDYTRASSAVSTRRRERCRSGSCREG